MKMYQQESTYQQVQYRFAKQKLLSMWNKMQMMKNLIAFSGDGSCIFADILIINIVLTKKLFLLDLSQGD